MTLYLFYSPSAGVTCDIQKYAWLHHHWLLLTILFAPSYLWLWPLAAVTKLAQSAVQQSVPINWLEFAWTVISDPSGSRGKQWSSVQLGSVVSWWTWLDTRQQLRTGFGNDRCQFEDWGHCTELNYKKKREKKRGFMLTRPEDVGLWKNEQTVLFSLILFCLNEVCFSELTSSCSSS